MPLMAAQPRAKRRLHAAGGVRIPAGDNDQTLRAMRDEMERSRTRLQLPGVDKPFYIEYRLLDVDVRSVTASFGALSRSDTSRSRFMSVDVRVGDYHLDSSNFVSEDGFRGFLGSTGQVGIDRDYNSLRQDLWLATDQAYKAAVTQMSLKQAFLRSLTKPPEIDDFSQAAADGEGRSAHRAGLDLAQLGERGAHGFGGAEELRADRRNARQLLSDLRHFVPDDQRGHHHPHFAQPRGH